MQGWRDFNTSWSFALLAHLGISSVKASFDAESGSMVPAPLIEPNPWTQEVGDGGGGRECAWPGKENTDM
jgi:hypothetical protein